MTLSISLTPQLEELVRAKVSSGMYNSASEVVREALRLMEEQDELRQIKLRKLRQDIQDGLNSGPGQYSTAEEAIARAKKKLNKARS